MHRERRLCAHHGVGVSDPLQVVAALGVGIGADAQTVGGMELLHEERAAGLDHSRELHQTGGGQQRLDGVLPQLQTAWGGDREGTGTMSKRKSNQV